MTNAHHIGADGLEFGGCCSARTEGLDTRLQLKQCQNVIQERFTDTLKTTVKVLFERRAWGSGVPPNPSAVNMKVIFLCCVASVASFPGLLRLSGVVCHVHPVDPRGVARVCMCRSLRRRRPGNSLCHVATYFIIQ